MELNKAEPEVWNTSDLEDVLIRFKIMHSSHGHGKPWSSLGHLDEGRLGRDGFYALGAAAYVH